MSSAVRETISVVEESMLAVAGVLVLVGDTEKGFEGKVEVDAIGGEGSLVWVGPGRRESRWVYCRCLIRTTAAISSGVGVCHLMLYVC